MTTQLTITNDGLSSHQVHITELDRAFDGIGDEHDIEGISHIVKPGDSVTVNVWDGHSLSIHEMGVVQQAESADDDGA